MYALPYNVNIIWQERTHFKTQKWKHHVSAFSCNISAGNFIALNTTLNHYILVIPDLPKQFQYKSFPAYIVVLRKCFTSTSITVHIMFPTKNFYPSQKSLKYSIKNILFPTNSSFNKISERRRKVFND